MDEADFLLKLKNEFLVVAPSDLDSWEESLLTYERAGTDSAMSEIKRLVHSMKGSAQAVGLGDLASLLHEFENAMARWSSKEPEEFVSRSLAYVDQLRSYFEEMRVQGQATASRETLSLLSSQ